MSAPTQNAAPAGAAAAVLKRSDPAPEGARPVQGIEFNHYAQRSITVEELVGGMANMGFQATSVGQAVRIINDMVSQLPATSRNNLAGN
jgi:deoxyhypusine synthase